MNTSINICRLCLHPFKGLKKTLSDDPNLCIILNDMFPDMNIKLVEIPSLCEECLNYIKFSLKIKNIVATNETVISRKLSSLKAIQENICRLCFRISEENSKILYENQTNSAEIRNIIKMAIAEMDFDLLSKPVICNDCWQIVKAIYLFKKRCWNIENVLQFVCIKEKATVLKSKQVEIISSTYIRHLNKHIGNNGTFLRSIEKAVTFNQKNTDEIQDLTDVLKDSSQGVDNIVKPVEVYQNNFTCVLNSEEEEEEELEDLVSVSVPCASNKSSSDTNDQWIDLIVKDESFNIEEILDIPMEIDKATNAQKDVNAAKENNKDLKKVQIEETATSKNDDSVKISTDLPIIIEETSANINVQTEDKENNIDLEGKSSPDLPLTLEETSAKINSQTEKTKVDNENNINLEGKNSPGLPLILEEISANINTQTEKKHVDSGNNINLEGKNSLTLVEISANINVQTEKTEADNEDNINLEGKNSPGGSFLEKSVQNEKPKEDNENNINLEGKNSPDLSATLEKTSSDTKETKIDKEKNSPNLTVALEETSVKINVQTEEAKVDNIEAKNYNTLEETSSNLNVLSEKTKVDKENTSNLEVCENENIKADVVNIIESQENLKQCSNLKSTVEQELNFINIPEKNVEKCTEKENVLPEEITCNNNGVKTEEARNTLKNDASTVNRFKVYPLPVKKPPKRIPKQLSSGAWACSSCVFKTKYKHHLQRHELLHDENAIELNCPLCVYSTKMKRNFLRHLKVHDTDTTLYCAHCYYVTVDKDHLIQHMATHTKPEKVIEELNIKMEVESSLDTYQCVICPYVTKREVEIKAHRRAHNSTEKIHKCPECYYITVRSESMKYHLKLHNKLSTIKTFKCKQCSYVCYKQTNLNSHMLVHEGSLKFQCDMCSYKAKRKSHLVNHMLLHKSPDKIPMYQCIFCTYRTKRKEHLTSHTKCKHKDRLTETTTSRKKSKPLQNRKCSLCQSRIRGDENTWIRHLSKAHYPSKSNIFKCYNCDFKTRYKAVFIRHTKIHMPVL